MTSPKSFVYPPRLVRASVALILKNVRPLFYFMLLPLFIVAVFQFTTGLIGSQIFQSGMFFSFILKMSAEAYVGARWVRFLCLKEQANSPSSLLRFSSPERRFLLVLLGFNVMQQIASVLLMVLFQSAGVGTLLVPLVAMAGVHFFITARFGFLLMDAALGVPFDIKACWRRTAPFWGRLLMSLILPLLALLFLAVILSHLLPVSPDINLEDLAQFSFRHMWIGVGLGLLYSVLNLTILTRVYKA